ncbi:hypothetical protein Droror1_Dr00024200 [Drosera rotundifolia]
MKLMNEGNAHWASSSSFIGVGPMKEYGLRLLRVREEYLGQLLWALGGLTWVQQRRGKVFGPPNVLGQSRRRSCYRAILESKEPLPCVQDDDGRRAEGMETSARAGLALAALCSLQVQRFPRRRSSLFSGRATVLYASLVFPYSRPFSLLQVNDFVGGEAAVGQLWNRRSRCLVSNTTMGDELRGWRQVLGPASPWLRSVPCRFSVFQEGVPFSLARLVFSVPPWFFLAAALFLCCRSRCPVSKTMMGEDGWRAEGLETRAMAYLALPALYSLQIQLFPRRRSSLFFVGQLFSLPPWFFLVAALFLCCRSRFCVFSLGELVAASCALPFISCILGFSHTNCSRLLGSCWAVLLM